MTATTIEPVARLSRDLARAAATLSDDEARFLVDSFYQHQDNRKRSANQTRALGESQEPHAVLAWLTLQNQTLEDQIKRALDNYTEAHKMGSWMREIVGIGPVIAAGLLAHIDIEKAPTVGHIWRFAGLDPTMKWDKGEKRPWNADLKTLCWKAGQSFMKFSGRDDCYYGGVYRDRKQYEVRRNDSGGNAEAATKAMTDRKIADPATLKWLKGCYPSGTTAAVLDFEPEKRLAYLKTVELKPGEGVAMVTLGQIDARARRYAVKLFLAHLHQIWFERHFGKKAPMPYPIQFLGHAHKIEPPQST